MSQDSEDAAMPLLDFDEVADLILQLGSQTSPSEFHGYLVGQLAAGQRPDAQPLKRILMECLDLQHEFSSEQFEQLRYIHMSSLNSLMDESLSFYPLLADDDDELELRLQLVSQWCQYFLSGFATVEKAVQDIPEIVNDALNDMAAISQVGIEPDSLETDEDIDAAEEDYAQLVEYIRLAVMNIFMEYIPAPSPASPNNAENPEGYLQAQDLFQQRKIH